ncbi:hypothetical protein NHL51_04310 [Leucobacter sp. gxy201]|uniref:hypothetical protein n=1 Tax=Leucobacter sp. gxy201 TaxID=2957200 RepID=UPI003DA0C17E
MIAPTPAERERADYAANVRRTIYATGPLGHDAALVADTFAHTPQTVMHNPLTVRARAYFDVSAEDTGAPALTRERLRAALKELADRGIIPSWVAPPVALAAVSEVAR